MIHETLREPALTALHNLLVHARLLAYQEAEQRVIASLLDEMDYLFSLMQEPDDQTELFVEVLAEMAERWKCRRAYDQFAQHLQAVS